MEIPLLNGQWDSQSLISLGLNASIRFSTGWISNVIFLY